MDVEQTLLKEARRRAGEPPAGHTKDCTCPECIGLKARALDIADEMAEGVLADLRDFREHEAEWERTVARRQTVAEAREVAAGAGQVRAKLQTSLEGHLRRAATIVANADGERMSDSQYQAFSRASARAAELAQQDRALEGLEARAVAVVNEARVYGPQSPNSFYMDLLLRSDAFDATVSGPARERQARYGQELAYEVRRGSPEGKRVERVIRERCRHEIEQVQREAEQRALGTDGGATATAAGEAASFVSPYFVLSEYTLFRGVARSFADQCHSIPLPAYGMRVYIARFTSAASVSEQTEGQAVAEASPSTGLEGSPIETVSGQVLISRQLSDRGLGGGGEFDLAVGKAIHTQLDQEIDKLALNVAITNGEAVTGQGSYSTKGLYQDLAKGREKLADTSGVRLRATHLFTSSDLFGFATRQVDGQERPILTPQFTPGFPIATGDDGDRQDGALPKWARFTGLMMPGSLPWFTDDNLASLTVGTTSEVYLLVAAPDQAIDLLEGEPILASFGESDAQHLQTRIHLRSYCAAVSRHAAGVAPISSAAYTQALV